MVSYRYHRDYGWIFEVILFLVIMFVCFSCTALVRDYGVDSCRERGGTPITRSWLSKDAWDVSCINVPNKQ